MLKYNKDMEKSKILKKLIKSFFASIIIIFLGTIGISAFDNKNDLRESIIGKIIFSSPKSKCPADMAYIQDAQGDYCIDKYEASAGDDCQFQNPENIMHSKINIDNPDCLALARPDMEPWVNISQNLAAAACLKSGKRLATNREWYRAALGTPDKDNNWEASSCQVDKNWGNQPGKTGSGADCISYSGTYDMIGNVWEWIDASIVDGFHENKKLPEQGFVQAIDEKDAFPSDTNPEPQALYNNDYFWIKDTEIRAVARGGYWSSKENAGYYSHYIVSEPNYAGQGIGFRCVKNVE